MHWGVCGTGETTAEAACAGYDFVEGSVAGLLKPREPEPAFRAALEALAEVSPLRCPVVNCFVPGDLRITGLGVDPGALGAYAQTVFDRARAAGVDTVVFGSGKARAIPEGFSRGRARGQLVDFCARIGPLAAACGVTVAVEPLNRGDCNVLNTVEECAELVREVGHPSVRLLADAYHMMIEGDPFDAVAEHGEWLAHIHIATVPNRLPPGAEPCDLAPFFAALKAAGYGGRVSIEGRIPEPARDLPAALSAMRTWARG